MAKIASEIRSGLPGIRTASLKYGLMQEYIEIVSHQAGYTYFGKGRNNIRAITTMMPELKESSLKREIQKLSKELEYAKLKILSLETMIKVAEEDLHIKIRKKRGTKQLKD